MPIVSNNANFVKPAPGQPVLISWDDANTMFHEFGHALHGLNSNVTYESLASPSQAQDFVEFPSQLNENWLWTPEVLNRFAVNVRRASRSRRSWSQASCAPARPSTPASAWANTCLPPSST